MRETDDLMIDQPGLSRKHLVRGILLVFALVELACVLGVLWVINDLTGWPKPPLLARREARYLEIVRAIEDGSLTAGNSQFAGHPISEFIVDLPASHADLAPLGVAYFEKRSDGRLFVFFPTWHGFHWAAKGYLYCSQPLTDEDFYFDSNWGIHRVLVCGYALEASPLRGPWYSVESRTD